MEYKSLPGTVRVAATGSDLMQKCVATRRHFASMLIVIVVTLGWNVVVGLPVGATMSGPSTSATSATASNATAISPTPSICATGTNIVNDQAPDDYGVTRGDPAYLSRLHTCTSFQVWKIEAVGTFLEFKNAYDGLCLEVTPSAVSTNGDTVTVATCSGSVSEEMWQYTGDHLINPDGKCLDATSNDYENTGDPLQQWTCLTNYRQGWLIESLTYSTPPQR